MLQKILLCLMVFSYLFDVSYAYSFPEPTEEEKKIFSLGVTTCKDIQETDYPTIFIPGIGASWYSEEGYTESKIKRGLEDEIGKLGNQKLI